MASGGPAGDSGKPERNAKAETGEWQAQGTEKGLWAKGTSEHGLWEETR